MTEDTKKNILNYITNNITPTSPSTAEVIKEKILNTDTWTSWLPIGSIINGFLQPNENYSGLGILYGSNTNGGFILLLDGTFTPIKLFTEFESGTALRNIVRMEQAEDNTFYFVDDTEQSTDAGGVISFDSTSEKRFVMVNNFTALDPLQNDYVLKFRTSYNLQDFNFFCKQLFKNPNSAHYVMTGLDENLKVKAIELTVKVGEPNTWSIYNTSNAYMYGSCLVDFNSDDQARIRGTVINNNNEVDVYKLYKNYSTQAFGTELVYTSSYELLLTSCEFTSFDVCYFVNDRQNSSYYTQDAIELYKIDYSTNTVTKIYSLINQVQGNSKLYERLCISNSNGELCVARLVKVNPNLLISNWQVYFQRLTSDTWNPQYVNYIKNSANLRYDLVGLITKGNFNYFEGIILNKTPYNEEENFFRYIQIKENYNSLNYNGAEYIDYNSTVSKQAEVYSNNSLVFARNLYNFTINGNQSNATVVVPNTYLNNINLDVQNLLSETNTEIVSNNNTITKNIYETLYLNFINTINVIDEFADVVYPDSAVYINNNINTGTQTNCNNTAITKAKITTENTTNIINISWTTIDDTHQETTFSIYVGEPILKIELISNDETTSYMTLDTSSLQTNNFYTISQKIRIE